MRYSRVITSLVDESVAAALGGYQVDDALMGRSTNGDLIRQMLIETVCDERFKAIVEPSSQWEESAQEFLEEVASSLMGMDDLNEEDARTIINQLLANFLVKMMRRCGVKSHSGKDILSEGNSKGKESSSERRNTMAGLKKAMAKMSFPPETSPDEEDDEQDGPLDEPSSEMGSPSPNGHGISAEDERRFELEFLHSIPQSLVKLSRIIGRCDNNAGESRSHFLNASKSDIAGITVGNDLSSLLPSEIALLSSPATEDIFLRNYAQKRLQVFASASSSDNGKKHQDGPVIICLDTSSSMTGDPWVVASALTMAVTIMAKRRHRKVLVVRYSFNHDLFEVKSLRSQRKEFGVYLSHALNGGNDEESMFKWLFSEVLPSMDSFSSADVLCISDFGWITVSDEVFEMISANKASGMKFYGLDTTGEGKNGFSCLSQAEHMPDSIIDSMWLWDQKSCSCREKLYYKSLSL